MELTIMEKTCSDIAQKYNLTMWELGRVNPEQMQICNNRILAVEWLKSVYRRDQEMLIGNTSKKYRTTITPHRITCTCASFVLAGKECKHVDSLAMKYLEHRFNGAKK